MAEGRRVLVVDDDPIGRLITTTQLQELGHDVVAVEDGAAAVETVAAGGIALVLMDRQMPTLDGCEAARRIRALDDPTSAAVPIAALSAGDDVHARAECKAAGMNDYLVKPIEQEVLAACVDRLLAAGASAEPSPPASEEAIATSPDAADIRRALGDLEVAVGGRPTVELAVTRFLEEASGWATAIAGDDLHVRSRTAHTLKGAARALGADEVGRWAQRLEEQPEVDVVSELRAALARAETILRDYLDETA